MSVLDVPATGGPGDAATEGTTRAPTGADGTTAPGGRRRLRRAGTVLIVVLVVLAVVTLTVLVTGGGDDEPLDPDSAGPRGSRALAEVLRDHGVRVTRVTTSSDAVRRVEAAASAPGAAGPASAGATLVVVRTHLLGETQLARLERVPGRLVVVEPDLPVLDGLGLPARFAGLTDAEVREPRCALSGPSRAGAALAGGHLYTPTGPAPGGGAATRTGGCYPGPDGDWSYLEVERDRPGPGATIIGQGDLLTNEELARHGNAALALDALGRTPEVVWYLPDAFENPEAAGPSLRDLLPPQVGWVAAQLVLATLLALAWRARRFGPLVTEPLPVVVRSAETLEGRAGLYRQAGARDRAAATLRTATLRRLAGRLDLEPGTSPEVAVALVDRALRTPWPAGRVHQVLLGPAPGTDAELVTLARDLDSLETALQEER